MEVIDIQNNMRKIFFLSLAMGLAAVATAQQPPVTTTKDYGLKGPVKKVSELKQAYFDGDLKRMTLITEFDEQGRLSNWRHAYDEQDRLSIGYAYDEKGRLVVSGDTYYAYDPNGRLMNEQSKHGYIEYNYDKNGRLLSCVSYEKGDDDAWNVNWVKTYKYDKRGRLLGAEATRGDKKNPKFIFSYQVVYAVSDVPKGYILKHMGEPVYDDYGEVVEAARMVVDTLPYNEWTTYNVNHGISDTGSNPDLRQYIKFDKHDNGVEWNETDVIKMDDTFDEYGELVTEGRDTIVFRQEKRSIEYYGEYDFNISLPEMNVVYAGVKNPIRVTVSGVPEMYLRMDPDDLDWDEDIWVRDTVLKAMDSTINAWEDYGRPYSIWTEEDGSYVLIPHVNQGTIRVPVVIIEEGGKIKIAGYQKFRVKKTPEPKLYIGNYPSGSVIPRDELVKMTGISVRYSEDLLFEVEPPTLGQQRVDISKVEGPGDLEVKGRSGEWNPDVLSYIAKAKKDSKLTIEATIQLSGGDIRTIIGSWTVGK